MTTKRKNKVKEVISINPNVSVIQSVKQSIDKLLKGSGFLEIIGFKSVSKLREFELDMANTLNAEYYTYHNGLYKRVADEKNLTYTIKKY
jgi:hypothetical protein